MYRIRNLELLFNLEKKKFKSKEDCVIPVLHCLLINENNLCVGTGDEWAEITVSTEMLPEKWNDDQDVYSLRYTNKNKTSRILLKVTKVDHILQVDAVMNEDAVASLAIPVSNYVSDDYSEYSSAYNNLESLSESFRKDILENLKPKEKKESPSKKQYSAPNPATVPSPPLVPNPPPFYDPFDPDPPLNPLRQDPRGLRHPRLPRVGGSDLNPFGGPGGGGMLMDPSSFGFPGRGPALPDFGIGGPGGLPRGAVPPGAQFYPYMPPGYRPGRDPNGPPGFEDDYI